MNTTIKTQVYAGGPEYDRNFWNMMRGKEHCQRNRIFQGETADFKQCRHSAQSIRKFTNTCKIQLDFCLIVR